MSKKKQSPTATPYPILPPINVKPPSKSKNILRWLWIRWSKGSKYTRGCMGITAIIFVCIGCSILSSLGQAVGLIPDYNATKTAEAEEKHALATNQAATAAVLALTPSSTPTATLTPTVTLTPTDTLTPTITYTPSPTEIPSLTPVPSATPAPTMTPQKRYATQTMNVRVCAGVECSVAGQLSYGDEFTATSWSEDTDGYTWYSFKQDGKTVWVAGWLTSTEKPSAPVVQQPAQPSAPQQPAQSQPTQAPAQPASVSPVRGAAQSCLNGAFDFSVCANYQRPSNCDEVRLWGIPDRVAGCCFPKLDRNGNGFACYE